MTQFPKIVESPHYHIWTDVLHARALAHQARNKWDQGTYVRWCVTAAWTSLEIACQEATGDPAISYRFRENLDKQIARLRLASIDWGAGIWQRVTEIQERRKGYVHRFVAQTDLFPGAEVADDTVAATRDAIIDIYQRVGIPAPSWTADDQDRGWDRGPGGVTANLTAIRAGADPESEETIRVCFVQNGKERTSDVLPPGAQWKDYVETLIRNVRLPISEVRVYQGSKLLESRELRMRGA